MTSNATRHSRIGLLGGLALALLATPSLASAEDFPAPTDAPAPAASDTDWSEPTEATAPTPVKRTTSALPPPRIVRRRTASAQANRTPRNATPSSTTRNNPMQPRMTQPRTPQPNTLQPNTMRNTPSTVSRVRSVGAGQTTAANRTATPTQGRRAASPAGRILSIKKTHNVQPDNVDGDALLSLQLDVEYEVIGQQGRDVFVAVWFARKDSGKLIQSLTHDYRDSAGNVTIQTRWTRVLGPRMTYAATLQIPYYTFPAHDVGESYEIEARVQVLRNEKQRGRVSVLGRDSTTFRVFGMSEEERDRANSRNAPFRDGGLDTRAFASPGLGEINEVGIPEGLGAKDVAGETGTILTPGIQDGSGAKATPGETGSIIDLPTKGNAGTR